MFASRPLTLFNHGDVIFASFLSAKTYGIEYSLEVSPGGASNYYLISYVSAEIRQNISLAIPLKQSYEGNVMSTL